MNNRYIKLKIPFASKGEILSKDKSLKMLANAYYIFDIKEQILIDEYIEILKTNYRVTDLKMIKTSHFKNKHVKEFRELFLNDFNNSNEIIYNELSNNKIIKINTFLREQKITIRSMYSLFSGSNPSGAETKSKSSQLRCIDNEFFDCNFANVVKKYATKGIKFKNKIYDKNMKTYTLTKMINSNILYNFRDLFYEYNKDLEFSLCLNLDNLIFNEKNDYKIDNINNNEFEPKENQSLFLYSSINQNISKYVNFELSSINNKLRSYYASNVNQYIKERKIPLLSTTTKYDLSLVENAHIIPFSTLVKIKTYDSLKDAINPYNCLRINSDIHKLFDKNIIKFDLKGNLLDRHNKIQKSSYLKVNIFPKQTMDFLKKRINS